MFELGLLNFWAEASAGNTSRQGLQTAAGARFHLFDKVSKVPEGATGGMCTTDMRRGSPQKGDERQFAYTV